MKTHHRLLTAALGCIAFTIAADARPLKPEQEALIKPAGEAVSCVNINQIRQTRVRDDSTIDFYMTGKRVYRNRLPHSCPSLGFEERFAYATSQSQLCSVDIITVLYSSPGPTQGASCGLGKFQPITGAPK
jgi:hypothetical protein